MSDIIDDPSNTRTSARAAKGAGIIFLSQVVTYAIFFLAQRTVLSTLTKEENGTLALIQQFSSIILLLLVDSGWSNIALREIIRRPEEEREIISSVLWIRLCGMFIALLIAIPLLLNSNLTNTFTAAIAVVAVAFGSRTSMMRSTFEFSYRVHLRMNLISLLSVLDVVLYFILLQFFREHLTPSTIFSLLLVSSLPGLSILIWDSKSWRYIIPLPKWKISKSLLFDVKPQVQQLIYQNIHSGIDIYVLKYFAPLSQVGVFGAIGNMSAVMTTTFASLMATLYPMLAESFHSDKGNSSYRVERTLSIIMFASVLIASTLSVIVPFIIEIFTSNVYAENVVEFQLQFWCTVLILLAQTSIVICSAMNNNRALLFSGLMLIVGSISADFILVPLFHTKGILLAKMWSNILCSATALWFIAKQTSTKSVTLFAIRFTVFASINSFFSLFLANYMSQGVSFVLASVLCIVSGWILGLVTNHELTLLRNLLISVKAKISGSGSAQV